MIKAVFFDLDGTLLSHTNGEIPENTKISLKALREKGIGVFLATGRHILEIDRLVGDQLKFDGYITLNGQLCLDEEKKIVSGSPIGGEDLNSLLTVFWEKEIPTMLIEQKSMYINFVNEEVTLAQKAISTPLPKLGTYQGEKIYQVIVYDAGERVEKIVAQLTDCKMSRWNQYAVDIISKTGGKVAGIQYFLDLLNIRQDEIAAFGDGENDIAMLEFAHIGIAMGNAEEEVKNKADYVTTHIDRDGIANGLKYLGLI